MESQLVISLVSFFIKDSKSYLNFKLVCKVFNEISKKFDDLKKDEYKKRIVGRLEYTNESDKIKFDTIIFHALPSGALHGEYIRKNAKLIKERKFCKDGLVINEVQYYNSGFLKGSATYSNGNPQEMLCFFDGKSKKIRSKTLTICQNIQEYSEYYPTGELKIHYFLKNGKEDGRYMEYYEDGTIIADFTYFDGKKTGVYTEYYENKLIETHFMRGIEYKYIDFYENENVYSVCYTSGNVQTFFVYYRNGDIKKTYQTKNGNREGKSIKYNKGKIVEVINYSQELMNGECITYNSLGSVKEYGLYSNGKKHGKHAKYNKNGKLQKECVWVNGKIEGEYFEKCKGYTIKTFYVNGEKHGKYSEVFNNGYIKVDCIYIHGNKEGIYYEYHSNGNIRTRANLVKGKMEGKCFGWHSNGSISIIANYKNGKLNGENAQYYEDGKLKIKGIYINDSLEGECILFHENGNTNTKAFYKNGLYHGKCYKYRADGTLQTKFVYIEGRIMKRTEYNEKGIIKKE